jgi:hypothetical protein
MLQVPRADHGARNRPKDAEEKKATLGDADHRRVRLPDPWILEQ